MDDLMCNEGYASLNIQKTFLDSNLLSDNRVLDSLMKLEEHYTPSSDYFKIIQKEITPYMRRLVVQWMFEVICLFSFFRTHRYNINFYLILVLALHFSFNSSISVIS